MTLDELLKVPELAAELPREAMVQLYRQAARLEADLRTHLLVGSSGAQATGQSVQLGVELTVEQVAKRINRPVGYVRELLRRKDLPGFRRGKYWVIPEADLVERQASRNGFDKGGSLTLPLSCDPGRASHHPKAARPYTVEVRRADRGPRGDREEVGDGHARHEGDD